MDCWPLTATFCGVLGLRYISTGDVLIRQIGKPCFASAGGFMKPREGALVYGRGAGTSPGGS